MKLILCSRCHDVVRLTSERRPCRCGAVAGKYLDDDWHAVYSGPAVPIGIDNIGLGKAITEWGTEGEELPINCWIMRKDYAVFKKVDVVT